jgi:hypothetical protein
LNGETFRKQHYRLNTSFKPSSVKVKKRAGMFRDFEHWIPGRIVHAARLL